MVVTVKAKAVSKRPLLSEAEQLCLEVRLTDDLQKRLDRYNKKFKSFQLRLEMDSAQSDQSAQIAQAGVKP